MRRDVCCCALIVACALGLSREAFAQEGAPPAEARTDLGTLEAQIEAVLGETASLQFLEQPLGDVVAFLEDRHKIEIQLDRAAIDTAGVNTDSPVSIEVEGISLRSALNLMLKSIDLTYCIRDGVLLVTTAEEVEQLVEPRVYDVHRFVDGVDEVGGYRRDDESIINLIMSHLAPTSWPEGNARAISITDRSMVVAQSDAIQRDVEHLVRLLNTAVDQFKEGTFNAPIDVDPDGTSATNRLQAALAEPTSLQFLEQPLADIVAFLEDRHKIEIQLDTQALDTAGVTNDTPVTIDVERIPLRNALNLMLETIDLTYTIRDEVLLITTSEEVESEYVTRIYPIKDLLDAEIAVNPPKPDRLDAPTGSLNGPRNPRETAADHLLEVFVLAANPNEGLFSSGYGALTFVPQCEGIVVTQSDDVHHRLDQMLAELRQAHAKRAVENPLPIDDAAASQVTMYAYRLAHTTLPNQPVKDLDKLAGLLERSVNPESWTAARDQNSMVIVDHALVIKTTNANHRQIKALLKQLGFQSLLGAGGGFQPKAEDKKEAK